MQRRTYRYPDTKITFIGGYEIPQWSRSEFQPSYSLLYLNLLHNDKSMLRLFSSTVTKLGELGESTKHEQACTGQLKYTLSLQNIS